MRAGIFLGQERPHENAILVAVRMAPPLPDDRPAKVITQASIYAAKVDEDGEYVLIDLSPEERESAGQAIASAGVDTDKWYWAIFLSE